MGLKIKAEETKAYKTYRNSPLGKALFDTIEELMEDGLLNHEQSIKLIKQFDVSLRKELRNACDNEISNFVIKANSLRSFRVLNGHHQVVLENVEVIRQVPIDVIQYHLRNSGKTTLNYSALNLKNPSEWMTWRRNNWLVGVPCIGKKIPKVVLLCSPAHSLNMQKTSDDIFIDPTYGKCRIYDHNYGVNPRINYIVYEPINEYQRDQEDDNNNLVSKSPRKVQEEEEEKDNDIIVPRKSIARKIVPQYKYHYTFKPPSNEKKHDVKNQFKKPIG